MRPPATVLVEKLGGVSGRQILKCPAPQGVVVAVRRAANRLGTGPRQGSLGSAHGAAVGAAGSGHAMLLCQRAWQGRPPLLLPYCPPNASPRPPHARTLQRGAHRLAQEFSRRVYSRRCGGPLRCQAGRLQAALGCCQGGDRCLQPLLLKPELGALEVLGGLVRHC